MLGLNVYFVFSSVFLGCSFGDFWFLLVFFYGYRCYMNFRFILWV